MPPDTTTPAPGEPSPDHWYIIGRKGVPAEPVEGPGALAPDAALRWIAGYIRDNPDVVISIGLFQTDHPTPGEAPPVELRRASNGGMFVRNAGPQVLLPDTPDVSAILEVAAQLASVRWRTTGTFANTDFRDVVADAAAPKQVDDIGSGGASQGHAHGELN